MNVFHPLTLVVVQNSVQTVGLGFVRTKAAEVVWVQLEHFVQVLAPFDHVLLLNNTMALYVNSVLAVVWHNQWLRIQTTVSDWVHSHPLVAFWRVSRNLGNWSTVFVEQFFWLVGLQPVDQHVLVFHVIL